MFSGIKERIKIPLEVNYCRQLLKILIFELNQILLYYKAYFFYVIDLHAF